MAMEKSSYLEKKKKRRRIKMKISSLLFVIVFIFWGIYYLLQSDLMNLTKILINGNSQVAIEEIENISGLVIHRNIFKYNLDEIAANIESHPYIKEAKVKRKLPNTISIQVKEREEYAIIPYMGSYIYIDEESIVLKTSDSYIANDHILITGVEFKSFKLGEHTQTNNDQELERAMDILRAAKMTSIFEMISEINISEKDNIRLITFDGIEVLLGKGENPAYTVVALDEVLVNLYTKNIRDAVIDMRYEGHISVKDRTIRED